MRSITLRIYLVVVAVLFLFALGAAWVAQRNLDHDREHLRRGMAHERYEALGELIENSMPPASADSQTQAKAVLDLSRRLRIPMALDDAQGHRLAAAPSFESMRQRHEHLGRGVYRQRWVDGRVLWLLKAPRPMAHDMMPPPPVNWLPFVPGLPVSLLGVLLVLFVAVALGAWPVARRLTRRIKALQQGVERFGDGQLTHRVAVEGRDEVADLALSFNQAAERIETLVTAHRSLLANASHELRSPLARMKMAVSLLSDASGDRARQLEEEIHHNIQELDQLVEEVLLASRLDARTPMNLRPVDVAGVLCDEARRFEVPVHDVDKVQGTVMADERLLRRAIRNLLENATRYGVGVDGPTPIEVRVQSHDGWLDLVVEDRGPGVPDAQRDRIFEPFYRLPGHAEHIGGVGLGLSLVRQIAQSHGGQALCEAREGGGSRFIIRLPVKGKA